MPYSRFIISCIGFSLACMWLVCPSIQHYDQIAIVWMSLHRTTFLDEIAVTLSLLGGLEPVLIFCGLCCITQLRSKSYIHVAFICLAITGSAAMGWILKDLVNRPRPDAVFAMVKTYGASFPSAHSLYSIVLACILLFIFRKHVYIKIIVILASIWPLIMGMSRVYLGVHYPTDVLAGWSIGLMWVALLQCAFSKFVYLKTNNF